MIGVYVGLVLAYGSIGFMTSNASSSNWIRHALLGLVTASALLHFYYDGFIWKVRETQTRSMLGIDGTGSSSASRSRAWPLWFVHGLRWAALIIPFGALCAAQLAGHVLTPLQLAGRIVEVLPNDAQSQLKYGEALHEQGRVEEAMSHYESAIRQNPRMAEPEFFLGLAYKDLRDYDHAIEHYEKSLSLAPKNGKYEFNLASALIASGRRAEGRRRLEHSLSSDPSLFLAHQVLADMLYADADYKGALAHYREALRLRPDFQPAARGVEAAGRFAGH